MTRTVHLSRAIRYTMISELRHFAPAAGRNPLREFSEDELDIFTASVIDSGRYDVIVMDIGSGLSAVDLACLGMAEKICFVNEAAGSSRAEKNAICSI